MDHMSDPGGIPPEYSLNRRCARENNCPMKNEGTQGVLDFRGFDPGMNDLMFGL